MSGFGGFGLRAFGMFRQGASAGPRRVMLTRLLSVMLTVAAVWAGATALEGSEATAESAVSLEEAIQLIDQNAGDLSGALLADRSKYVKIYGALDRVSDATGSVDDETRATIYNLLSDLVDRYPQYFGETELDLSQSNRVALVRLALRGAMMSSLMVDAGHPDYNQANFRRLADDFGLTGPRWNAMARHGTFLVDNSTLSDEHVELVDRAFASRDASTFQSSMLTFRDVIVGRDKPNQERWDGEGAAGRFASSYNFGAANAFPTVLSFLDAAAPFGEVFGDEAPRPPLFAQVVSHEYDHQSLDSPRTGMRRAYGNYYDERKKETRRRQFGSDLVLNEKYAALDREKTQQLWRDRGLWSDGESWDVAWDRYWTRDRLQNAARDNLDQLATAPQESFATLGNLFAVDAYRFLELAQQRAARGLRGPTDEFLLYVDYGSRARGWMYFPTPASGGEYAFEYRRVTVVRNGSNHVTGLDFGNGVTVSFPVDGDGFSTGAYSVPTHPQMLGASNPVDPRVSIVGAAARPPAFASASVSLTGSGLCVGPTSPSSGAPLQQLDCSGGVDQAWTFDTHFDGSYQVKNGLGLCLEVPTGGDGSLVQSSCDRSDGQRFELRPQSVGVYSVVTADGRCLDVVYGSKDRGTKVQAWPCSYAEAQQFEIEQSDRSSSVVQSVKSLHSGLCATLESDGQKVTQRPCNDEPSQDWSFEKSRGLSGTVAIRDSVNGNCLVPADSSNNSQILAQSCTGSAGQQWIVASVVSSDSLRITNAASSRCVDLFYGNTSAGFELSVAGCHGGSPQQWSVQGGGGTAPPTPPPPPPTPPSPEPPVGGSVSLFEHGGFGGVAEEFGVGSHSLAGSRVGDDTVSSVQVPSGFMVRLCENTDGTGDCVSYDASTGFVGGMNDRASYLQVSEGTLPPAPGRVALFEHGGFGGVAEEFGVGSHSLVGSRVGDDAVSSVQIPSGFMVRLCENSDGTGNCVTYDASGYVGGNMNDKASSLQVSEGTLPPAVGKVSLFEHGHFGGVAEEFGVGSHSLVGSRVGDDAVSSVQIPSGFTARLCENSDGTGKCVTYDESTIFIGGINDKASYLEVSQG